MPTTRAFKSGNSQAVRIPAEIAYADTRVELTITRNGDVITIYPKRIGSMAEMVAALRALPTPSEVEVREPIELPDREGN
jgi:antitoxin VapB